MTLYEGFHKRKTKMKNVIKNVAVQVLFNGKPCKQYTHDGQLFIESKDGSEYLIQVKNDNDFRIECVIGVDGLDVITGKENKPDSIGYIINGYGQLKLDGYRLSDEKVATFKFCKRGESYASSKTVSGAQNGVITITCYREKPEPKPKIVEKHFHHYPPPLVPPWKAEPWVRPDVTWICHDNTAGDPVYGATITTSGFLNSSNKDRMIRSMNSFQSGIGSAAGNLGDTLACNFLSFESPGVSTRENDQSSAKYDAELKPSDHFDMGTTFGEEKYSPITHVEWKRGARLGQINLFYATRNSLQDMGIDLTEKKQVVYPTGESQYCTPPVGWKR